MRLLAVCFLISIENTLVYLSLFSETSNDFLKKELSFDQCKKYEEKRDDNCASSNFDPDSIVGCSKYVWDRSQWGESLTTINNLVCEKDNVRRLSGSILLLGLLVGKLTKNYIIDNIGL